MADEINVRLENISPSSLVHIYNRLLKYDAEENQAFLASIYIYLQKNHKYILVNLHDYKERAELKA